MVTLVTTGLVLSTVSVAWMVLPSTIPSFAVTIHCTVCPPTTPLSVLLVSL